MAKPKPKKSAAKAKPAKVIAKAKPAKVIAKAKPAKVVAKAKPAKVTAKAKPAKVTAKAKPAKVTAKAKPAKATAKAKPAKVIAKAKPAKVIAKAKPAASQQKPSKAALPDPTKGFKSVFKAIKNLVTSKKDSPTAIKATAADSQKVAQAVAPKVAGKGSVHAAGEATTGLKGKIGQAITGALVAPKVPAKIMQKLVAIPIPDEVKTLSPKAPVVDVSEEPVNRVTHQNDLFTPAEMAVFLSTLVAERQTLLSKARAAVEGGNIALDKDEMYDEVDLASATVDQNLTFRLLDRDRKLLGEIDHAIQKIESGEFGYCEGTYEPIPKRRLELRPWCRHSVKYKEQLEKLEKSGRGLVDEDAELLD
jgi:DnaK suppressor protein